MSHRILVDRNLPVPMRDGTLLMTDVYRTAGAGPLPAIVVRLPYGKSTLSMQAIQIEPVRAAEVGFAVVYQDTRGRFLSEGEFYPFVHEGADGYDTVEWVAGQPWCNGQVGMTGASYVGVSQWLTAVLQPPHLQAIFPIVSPSDLYEGMIYQGGAFQLGFTLLWTLLFLAPDTALRRAQAGEGGAGVAGRLLLASAQIADHYAYLPLSELPTLRESGTADYYFDWMAHQNCDVFWQSIDPTRLYDRVQVPAYNVGGWYDLFLLGTLENYARMREEGGTEAARAGQRLRVGPWAHGVYGGTYPDRSYGVQSSAGFVDLTGLQLRYFDYHLKGLDNGFDQDPPVRIFVMGEDRWRDEEEWPLARTHYECWFLRSGENAGGAGGGLSPAPPSREVPDVYEYDPHDPAPTIGGPSFLPGVAVGANCGPKDQRATETRPDILIYSSEPLQEALEVTGPLEVILYASTTVPDTDFVARLCDVSPDGTSRIIAEGILRARFREGYDRPSLVNPGEVNVFRLDLVATSNLFKVGHRVRVHVTSSSFPRFDRNPNTGRRLGQDRPSDLRSAVQTVFHDAEHPSHIVLPVVPRQT